MRVPCIILATSLKIFNYTETHKIKISWRACQSPMQRSCRFSYSILLIGKLMEVSIVEVEKAAC